MVEPRRSSSRSNSTTRRDSERSGQQSFWHAEFDTDTTHINDKVSWQKVRDDLQRSRASRAGSLGSETPSSAESQLRSQRNNLSVVADNSPPSSTRPSVSTGDIRLESRRSGQQSFQQVAGLDVDTEATQIKENGSWRKVRDDLQLSRASRTGSLGSQKPPLAESQLRSQRNNLDDFVDDAPPSSTRHSISTGDIWRESRKSGQQSFQQVAGLDLDTEATQINENGSWRKVRDDLQLSRASRAGSLGSQKPPLAESQLRSQRNNLDDFADDAPPSSTRHSISTGDIRRESRKSGQQSFQQVAGLDVDTEATQINENGTWREDRDDLQVVSRASRAGSGGGEQRVSLSRGELAGKSEEESQEVAQRVEQCRRESAFAKESQEAAKRVEQCRRESAFAKVSGLGRKRQSNTPTPCGHEEVSDDDVCSSPSIVLPKDAYPSPRDSVCLPSSGVVKSKTGNQECYAVKTCGKPKEGSSSALTAHNVREDDSASDITETDQQKTLWCRTGQMLVELFLRKGKRHTLDTNLPIEQHAFLVWFFDEQGAKVHRLKAGAPSRHGICVGDRLIALNGECVIGKKKDEIKQIWSDCLDDGPLLHVDLVSPSMS